MGNILVFGASGQLGQCFKNLAEKDGLSSMYFLSEAEANILDYDALKRFLKYINHRTA